MIPYHTICLPRAQVLTNDNLELGCTFIEKAATDKAICEIDERLLPAYQARPRPRRRPRPLPIAPRTAARRRVRQPGAATR
jgi:hypothetical protein